MFRDLIKHLAGDFHLIAPDYPAFGHSDAPDRKSFVYTFDNLADIVDKLSVKLGLTKFGIYMQYFGGPVGFRLASRHPEKVSFFVVQNANA